MARRYYSSVARSLRVPPQENVTVNRRTPCGHTVANGIISDVPSQDDSEKLEALREEAFNDALYEQLEQFEELERRSRYRSRVLGRFLVLAGSLSISGVAAAATAVDASSRLNQLSDVRWAVLLGAASAVATIVLVAANLGPRLVRLRDSLRDKLQRSNTEAEPQINQRAEAQVITLHNYLLRQQSGLHYEIRRQDAR